LFLWSYNSLGLIYLTVNTILDELSPLFVIIGSNLHIIIHSGFLRFSVYIKTSINFFKFTF